MTVETAEHFNHAN